MKKKIGRNFIRIMLLLLGLISQDVYSNNNSEDNATSKTYKLTVSSESIIGDEVTKTTQGNAIEQTLGAIKNTRVPLYYIYTDAYNEGFVGPVHQVTTKTQRTIKYFELDDESYMEFDRNGNYTLYRISSGDQPGVKRNEILFPKRLLEGRIYNIPNAWSGHVSSDFSITRPLIPLASPIVCTKGTTKYYYKDGRLDYIDVLGQLKYTYKYNDEGGIVSRSENGKPYIKMDCEGILLKSTYQYDREGKETDKTSFVVSGNTMTIKEKHYPKANHFSFDNEGRVVHIKGLLGNAINSKMFTRSFTYQNGLIVKEVYQDPDNTIINELAYDKRGNVVRFVNNNIVFTFKYAYNEKGDWIRRTCYEVLSGDINIEREVFTQHREIIYY